MATTWITSGVGWTLVLLGWWMSPAISFLLNRFFSYLDFDARRKLRGLEIDTIPKQKQTLRDAEQHKMMGMLEAEDKMPKSDLIILDKIMDGLKSALYEAEDMLDLVDYLLTQKRVTGHGPVGGWIASWAPVQHLQGPRGDPISHSKSSCFDQWRCRIASWVQRLRGAASTWISRCKSCFRPSIDTASSADAVSTAVPVQDVSVTIDANPCSSSADAISRAEDGSTAISTTGEVLRAEDNTSVSTSSADAESVSIVHKLRLRWSSDLVPWIIRSYRWILASSTKAVANVLYYRGQSNEAFGVRINQEDVMALDSFLHTVSRMWLKKRIQQIEDILNDSRNSHLLHQQSNGSENSVTDDIRRNQISIGQRVFGRDEERDDICNTFRDGPSSEDRRYSVIGIHGIAGSGKSTLAQYVCDYEKKLKDNDEIKKHFDLVMFVNVSGCSSIVSDMLEQMTKQKPSDDRRQTSLQEELKEKLNRRRFLLVLDDVWVSRKNRKELSDLPSVLNCGESGSGLLVTAQREDAARAQGAQKLIAISDLKKEQYFSLFKHHVLPLGGSLDDEHIKIGKMIAEKLRRSPIAAVTVATRLRVNKGIEFWKTAAKLDLLKETRGALWWSYQQLNADIRRCFAYLSTFPRGYKLKRVELVRMWVAHGYVKTSNKEYDVEDLGHGYFDELLKFSFLLPSINGEDHFTIHDLLHGLAEEVAGRDFFRIGLDGTPKDIPPGVRHLFIETNDGVQIQEKDLYVQNLRTLIIKEHSTDGMQEPMEVMKRNPDLGEILECLFTGMRKLRVLIIELNHNRGVLSIPASIGRMKLLRYVCFHHEAGFHRLSVSLPSTFSKLYLIQTIDFSPRFIASNTSVSYPEDMANLIHLRHICADMVFPNIGRLTSLQTMKAEFSVCKGRQGYELEQLRDLNKLRGALRIECLHNVGRKVEALGTHLARKVGVTELTLSFSASASATYDPDIQAEVLEGLCPPKDLEKLKIEDYKGSRYPTWMLSGQPQQHQDTPKDLRKLELIRCSPLASFPEDSKFFTSLRELRIKRCDWDNLPENTERLVSLQILDISRPSPSGHDQIRRLPTLPPSLKVIRILSWDCLLEDMEHLASLRWLSISECNKMQLLPTLPRSLKEIFINSDVLRRTCQEEGHPNWLKIQHIPHKYMSPTENNFPVNDDNATIRIPGISNSSAQTMTVSGLCNLMVRLVQCQQL